MPNENSTKPDVLPEGFEKVTVVRADPEHVHTLEDDEKLREEINTAKAEMRAKGVDALVGLGIDAEVAAAIVG